MTLSMYNNFSCITSLYQVLIKDSSHTHAYIQDIAKYGRAPFSGWVIDAGWSVGRGLSGAGH